MEEEKVLTIAVPAYNAEKTLSTSLDSIAAPGVLPFLDIIVINDGSQDATGEIAEDYARRYPGSFRVIHKENGGHGSGINTAIKTAKGKYFKVLDADDTLLTGNLAAFVDSIRAANADVVLTHFYMYNTRNGKRRMYRTEGISLNREYSFDDFWSAGKGVRGSCRFHGICYLTDFYRKTGVLLSEKIFFEDHEYATLPFQFVQSILPLDMFLYEYIVGRDDQSVADNNRLKYINQIEHVLWRLWEQFSRSPDMLKAPAAYFCYKMSHVLFSYYVLVLLINPDRKEGRLQARAMRNLTKSKAACLYRITRLKYWAALVLHCLGISWAQIMSVQHTQIYRLLFKVIS